MSSNNINRESRGFLDLLRAKVGGQGPERFSSVLQPTIELLPFLSNQQLKTAGSAVTSNSASAGTALEIVMPNQELWLIHAVTAAAESSDVTTAGFVRGYVSFNNIPLQGGAAASLIRLDGFSGIKGATTPLQVSGHWRPSKPFLLPPGSKIEATRAQADGVITWTWRVQVLYSLLQV